MADDNKSNFMANVITVVDDNKSNFMVSVTRVADDNKTNSMVSVNKMADKNEANYNVNMVDDYINRIVSACLYIATVTAQRPRTCRNTCEMSYFSGVRVDQLA